MDQRLLAICHSHGAFLTREALALGYDDKAIAAAVRVKLWHRIRRGAYTAMTIWMQADEHERHRIRCRAVMRSLGDRVAISHASNLVMRGVAVWNVDLSKVHVTRLDGGPGRTEHDVVHHEGVVTSDEVERFDGVLMLSVPRAVVESLTLSGVEAGLVFTDNAQHLGLVSKEDIDNAYALIEEWPYIRSAQIVVRLTTGLAQSVGESRVYYACWEQGLPAPEQQFKVYDEHGELIATTDFAWRKQGLLGEFDGRIKYGRLLKPGQEPGDVVFAEKVREDAARAASRMGMVRVIWSELDHRPRLAHKIEMQFRNGPIPRSFPA